MAFENPFLKPSSTRQAALKYLFSDEPDTSSDNNYSDNTSSIVDTAFSVSESTDTINNIAMNVARNGGEYNPNDNVTDVEYDPLAVLGAIDKYGNVITGIATALGVGGMATFAKSLAQQKAANDVSTMLTSIDGQLDKSNLTASVVGKGLQMAGVPLANFISGKDSDSIKTATQIANMFEGDKNAFAGYIGMADPFVSDVAQSMLGADGFANATAADLGRLGQLVGADVQNRVAGGLDLAQAQEEAKINFLGAPEPVAPAPAPPAPITPPASSSGGMFTPVETFPVENAPLTPATPLAPLPPAPAPVPVAPPPSSSSSSSSGGYDYSSAGETGMATNSAGQTVSNDASISAQDAATFGPDYSSNDSSSGSSSSKIVCTAMNEAYGFGSFRNKIWLAYAAKNLTKAHEVGYHALFLPLVDLAYRKDIKPLRYALENIARHRSADLRAEMRGTKRDNLGRAYRFVLEPLCFVIGKIKGS